ncbi:hypothetical protein ATO6_01760 [Oceanicola sp. 22II-s10i]|uniref:LysR family transcriptional regulator n=1 Tax=Oceanicola sp. 22II-s10i TaxID=1317116 RepID=UPI000B522D6B|nr:LysR substrate-binding domain-containing protein [Oceanicola sp. 22II-s10i]OWU85679.1 hypothetical protein ATO6_01760 [Oceanicola sp. 22II-s10i]
MDFRQLRYFVTIAEAQSFSRAAMFLNVAQPALSLHVRNMEAELGTELLIRTPQGVTPTEAGTLLLDRARMLLADFESALQEVRDLAEEPAGEVHIGLPGTISELLSVPLILKVRERHPKIHLRVAEAMSGFVLSWLQEGDLDLGLIYTAVSGHGLRSTPVLTEELRLFAAPGRADAPASEPVDPATIAALPLILPGPTHGLRAQMDREVEAAGSALGTVTEVDSYNAIKDLVARGAGFSVLPVNAIAREEAAGELQSWTLGTPPIRRTVHIVQPEGRPASKAALAVRALCVETLEELIAEGRWLTGAGAISESYTP